MAMPAVGTNLAIDGSSTGSGSGYFGESFLANRPVATYSFKSAAAYKTSQPGIGGSTVTCNLTSDTLIIRPDGSIWDDTQQCWIPIDVYNLSLAVCPFSCPRVQD